MTMIASPLFKTEKQWADAIVAAFPAYGLPQYREKFDEWASSLLNIAPFSGKPIPRPEQCPEWQTWAKIVQGIMET